MFLVPKHSETELPGQVGPLRRPIFLTLSARTLLNTQRFPLVFLRLRQFQAPVAPTHQEMSWHGHTTYWPYLAIQHREPTECSRNAPCQGLQITTIQLITVYNCHCAQWVIHSGTHHATQHISAPSFQPKYQWVQTVGSHSPPGDSRGCLVGPECLGCRPLPPAKEFW